MKVLAGWWDVVRRRKGGDRSGNKMEPTHLAGASGPRSGVINPCINLFIQQAHYAPDTVDTKICKRMNDFSLQALLKNKNSYKQNNYRLNSTLMIVSKEEFQRS